MQHTETYNIINELSEREFLNEINSREFNGIRNDYPDEWSKLINTYNSEISKMRHIFLMEFSKLLNKLEELSKQNRELKDEIINLQHEKELIKTKKTPFVNKLSISFIILVSFLLFLFIAHSVNSGSYKAMVDGFERIVLPTIKVIFKVSDEKETKTKISKGA